MTYVVGITGGIATGKSTIANYLRDQGFKVLDMDQMAHQVQQPHTRGYRAIVDHFGPEILNDQGQIDRKALGRIVFSNPDALEWLNQLIHPLVFQALEDQIQMTTDPFLFVEVPLLYEAGRLEFYDQVWVAFLPYAIQIQRLMARDQLDQGEAQERIASQLPTKDKADQADVVICTAHDLKQTYSQITKALQELPNPL
ncbi:dephospho-CoA kinase [Facklamia languida]